MVNSLNNQISVQNPTNVQGKPTVVQAKGTLFGHNVTIEVKGKIHLSQSDIKKMLSNSTVGKSSFKDGATVTKLTYKSTEITIRYNESTLKTKLEGLKNKKLIASENKTNTTFQTILNVFSKSSNKPQELNSSELQLLGRLSQMKDDDDKLTQDEKKALANLLVKSLGNSAVNKQMSKLLKDPKKAGLIDESIIEFMRNFSFRTRGCENSEQLAEKTENLMKAIHEGTDISDTQKLTLEELGTLESLMKIKGAIGLIKENELDKGNNPELAALVKGFERSERVMGQIEGMLQKYSNLKDGDLLFVNNNKENRFRSIEATFEEIRETYMLDVPLHHAGVNFKKGDQDTISQVMSSYEHETNNLQSRITSSTYRLDPSRLLTKDKVLKEYIARMYADKGQSYSEEINKMYQATQNKLQAQGLHLFENVMNDETRRNRSGLAHVLTFLHKSTKTGGAARYQEMHQAMMRGDLKAKKMICSEFAAKTMVAGLLQQENELKQTLIDYLITKEKMSPEDAQNLVMNASIFTLPFADDESLSRMTPARMLEVLAQAGSINRIDPHPLLQGLVKANDLKVDSGEEVIPLFNVSGYNADEADKAEMKPTIAPEARRVPKDNTLESKWTDLEKLEEVDLHKARVDNEIRPKAGENKTAQEKLYELIRARREEIKEAKEYWRRQLPPSPEIQRLNAPGRLTAMEGGLGGAYRLKNKGKYTEYIIKPSDEDILTLNNRKVVASPLDSKVNVNRARKSIPKYRTVQTEVLSYKVAEATGFAGITPKTEMVILKNEAFHDVLDNTKDVIGKNQNTAYRIAGRPDKEKLCSAQEFVANEMDVNGLDLMRQKNNWTEAQFDHFCETMIVQSDFEKCLLFACITGETDGNMGNYLFVKTKDNEGNDRYGMRKIDNALCFPDKNTREFSNCLTIFPNIDRPLSEEGRELVRNLDENAISLMIDQYLTQPDGTQPKEAVEAFKKRIALLKQLVKEENISLSGLNDGIQNMKKPSSGKKVSFPDLPKRVESSQIRLEPIQGENNLMSSTVFLTPSPREAEPLSPRRIQKNRAEEPENLMSSTIYLNPSSPRDRADTPIPKKKEAISPRGTEEEIAAKQKELADSVERARRAAHLGQNNLQH